MAIQQGWNQQTSAVQNTLRKALGTTVRRARRVTSRAVAKATGKRRSKKKRAAPRAKRAHLVKGSAAAKRYMARIRAKRK